MAALDPVILNQAIMEMEQAGFGQKKAVLSRWLGILGVTEATFYREAGKMVEPERKARADRGRRKRPEYEAWVEEIMRLKYTKLRGVRSLTTADARELALKWGLVPPEAADLPEGTINRIARERNIRPAKRRENRFEAARGNQLHQVDASRSEYFQVHRVVGGEWILKLSPRQFKNRAVSESGQRVWVWGLVDDYSGCRAARYCIARGENAADGIEFLQWAWSKVADHAPFQGIPDILYMDNGPLAKTKAFQHFCREVAGVDLKVHEAYRSQATGKCEAGWKDIWRRFEAKFLREPGWQDREFSLAELNQEIAAYVRERVNRRDHRRLPGSKEAAWLESAHAHGGVVEIELEAWKHIFHRLTRTLDAAGCFDFERQVYQVKEIHSCQVQVWKGVTDGALLAVDQRDKRKYPAVLFQPKPLGDYRSGKETPLEVLLKQPVTVEGEAKVTFMPEEGTNVVHLVRTAEKREGLELPVAVEAPSLEEVAQGVRIIEGEKAESATEEVFASEVDWYAAMRVRELRGEALDAETLNRMNQIREESRAYRLLRDDIERRARLAVVE